MSPEDFSNISKYNSPYAHISRNYTCGFGNSRIYQTKSSMIRRFWSVCTDSNVHIYPSAWHNPMRTAVCITKDGSITYYRPNQNGRIKDHATGQNG